MRNCPFYLTVLYQDSEVASPTAWGTFFDAGEQFQFVVIAIFVAHILVDHAPFFRSASTTSDSMVRAG
jgi:hypothetical protein